MADPSTVPDDDTVDGRDISADGPDISVDGAADEATPLPMPAPRPNGSILMAAMLGLANALGMEQKDEPSEMVQPADPLDDDLDLVFGSLRPLDD